MAAMDIPLPSAAEPADPGFGVPPPFTLVMPKAAGVPLVFASPHSGRRYSADFLAAARLDAQALRRSEDSHVEALFAAAPGHGAPLLAATFPRAYCDVNREAWELDPAMFEGSLPPWVNTTSPRVEAGLGTIARVVATGEAIYRDKLRFADAERRIRELWQPYHDTLSRLIWDARRRHGACLLVDCHSMPAHAVEERHAPPDIVLGDAHGTACGPAVIRMVERSLLERGYSVRRNNPYAGGYVTRYYGKPREGIHVLQIELARGLYMDELTNERSAGFEKLRQHLTALIAELAAATPDLLGLA